MADSIAYEIGQRRLTHQEPLDSLTAGWCRQGTLVVEVCLRYEQEIFNGSIDNRY